ncbi:MAG TPA: SMC-Scp complex subunit ScpB [Candidatus Dormibacteraeota bacterium]|nr:SMC-Scp complex subunit ScpB [Candidatus Dormibacteraeota bacterium]
MLPSPSSAPDAAGLAPAPAPLDARGLAAALEAVLFVRGEPLAVTDLARILDADPAAVRDAAELCAEGLRDRGLLLQEHGGTFQIVTHPRTAWAVERALHPDAPTRLSRAALETLAIIAYRQPVTRQGIESIRGVNCEAVLENLERRELIVEVGREQGPGHPRLFGTTLRFLQVVGISRIDDLPPMPSPGGPGPEGGAGDRDG